MVAFLLPVILLAILGAAFLMLYILTKAAKNKGEKPARWRLAIVMIWTFIWIVEQWLARNSISQDVPHWKVIGITILGCILSFLILLIILRRKQGLGEWDDKMNEIGKE